GGRKPVVTAEKLERARAILAKGLTVREAATRLKAQGGEDGTLCSARSDDEQGLGGYGWERPKRRWVWLGTAGRIGRACSTSSQIAPPCMPPTMNGRPTPDASNGNSVPRAWPWSASLSTRRSFPAGAPRKASSPTALLVLASRPMRFGHAAR